MSTTNTQVGDSDLQTIRRKHLEDAISGPWDDVDDGRRVDDALDIRRECPRYFTRSTTDGDDYITRFALDDTINDVQKTIASGIRDSPYAWWHCEVLDLNNGEEVTDISIDSVVSIRRSADAVRADLIELFRDRLPSAARLELVPSEYENGEFLALSTVLDDEGRHVWPEPGKRFSEQALRDSDYEPLLVELTELTEMEGLEPQTIQLRELAGGEEL
jgi:hypothetical protein